MEQKTLKYITVEGGCRGSRQENTLDAQVNKLLAEGWVLYGSPYANPFGLIFQAMVKEGAAQPPEGLK